MKHVAGHVCVTFSSIITNSCAYLESLHEHLGNLVFIFIQRMLSLIFKFIGLIPQHLAVLSPDVHV